MHTSLLGPVLRLLWQNAKILYSPRSDLHHFDLHAPDKFPGGNYATREMGVSWIYLNQMSSSGLITR